MGKMGWGEEEHELGGGGEVCKWGGGGRELGVPL